LDEWALRHRERTDPDSGEQPVSAELGRREDLAAVEAIGLVSALARRIMQGELPPGVSERHARRLLLEHKIEAFDLIAARKSGQPARDARAHATEAFQELVAWHRDDLEPHLSVDSVTDAELETYRFALHGRPVAELAFTAEGSDEDTGWFRWSIDAQAFETEPDAVWWLGDPWPVEVAGVDVDELVTIGRQNGRQAVLAAAGDVVQRTRATALACARSELLGTLASDLAQGVGPFESGGLAGPAARD
jgi:hypothetical protein